MSNSRYTEEFKIEAVKQVADRGHSVADVAARLGVSGHSLYQWIKRYSKPTEQRQQDDELQAEIRRLKSELKRVSEERDILKKAARYFANPLAGCWFTQIRGLNMAATTGDDSVITTTLSQA